MYAIGNAEEEFHNAVNTVFEMGLLQTAHRSMEVIIDDPAVASVGGNLQYGRFDENGDFETLGKVDGTRYFIGGIDINSRPHSHRGNLITCYTFIEV